MKKTIYTALCAIGVLAASCSDYLNTSSPSVVDAEFVFSNMQTARAAMNGVYEQWRTAANTLVFGDGLFYAADVAGSDIERHPEKYTAQPGRHIPESFYSNGEETGSYGLLSYQKEGTSGAYGSLFSLIGKANAVITAMQSTSTFAEMMAQSEPSDRSQLYGEALAARATAYRELIKYYGDVPFQTRNGEVPGGLSPRDSIYDVLIAELIEVEPLMYRVGENGVEKNFFSRTYVQGLIARMALEAAGYQTRRVEFAEAGFYKNAKGEVLTFEQMGNPNSRGVYARRSDWRTLYQTAKTYYGKIIENAGTARFHETDPRSAGSNGQQFGNPYQYFFQQMNDLEYADESIYEYAMTQGVGNSSRPYSIGRPSSGGSKQAFCCKNYGQARINPAFYYGEFDPKDYRRDVSITPTGSDGKGNEKLISFKPNSKADGGGLSLNKWDENRMKNPYVTGQRKSGINGPYMRMAEAYLGYAEACAQLGDNAEAMIYLKKVRERSFPAGEAKTEAFVASRESLFEAIIDERGFEYAGEGDRRWTLIRTGLLAKKVKHIKEQTKLMLDGLKNEGSYEFSNGNVISDSIWTKMVDAKAVMGYRLTTQCPAGEESNALKYPSWRGTNDDWDAFARAIGKASCYTNDSPKTNVAIRGMFDLVSDEEQVALQQDGYKKVAWGAELVNNYDEYYTYLFYKYDYVSAPIYLWPFTPNVVASGGFTNGYGFSQE